MNNCPIQDYETNLMNENSRYLIQSKTFIQSKNGLFFFHMLKGHLNYSKNLFIRKTYSEPVISCEFIVNCTRFSVQFEHYFSSKSLRCTKN